MKHNLKTDQEISKEPHPNDAFICFGVLKYREKIFRKLTCVRDKCVQNENYIINWITLNMKRTVDC